MTVKIKIKSSNHPALDLIVQEYGLTLKPLIGGVKGAELHLQADNLSYEARASLQTCEDVLEVVDDHGNHQPI